MKTYTVTSDMLNGLRCKCSGCDHVCEASDLIDIDSCVLDPGDDVPAGRCPIENCGALAYVHRFEPTDTYVVVSLAGYWGKGATLKEAQKNAKLTKTQARLTYYTNDPGAYCNDAGGVTRKRGSLLIKLDL